MFPHILTAQELVNQVWSDKHVSIYEKQVIIHSQKISVMDICLHAQHTSSLYLSPLYAANIGTGITIIEYLQKSKSKKQSSIIYSRRSLPSIEEVKEDYLLHRLHGIKLRKNQKEQYHHIFDHVNQAFDSGLNVEITKTQFVEGSDIEVSFCWRLASWIISVQNCSVVVGDRQDFKKFGDKYYRDTLRSADVWFQILQQMQESKLMNLKKYLSETTLVGRIVDKTKIIWLSLIENQPNNSFGQDHFEVKDKLQELGLTFTKIKSLGIYNRKDQNYLDQLLKNTYDKISSSPLESVGNRTQNSVIYFTVNDKKKYKSKHRNISALKILTNQTKIYEMMKKKLKETIFSKQVQKVEKQCCQKLKKYSKIIFPTRYYVDLFKNMVKLLSLMDRKQEFIENKFIPFVKVVLYMMFKKISIDAYGKRMIENESFISQVQKIPIQNFGSINCKQAIIYCYVGIPGEFKNLIVQKLNKHFQIISLPFSHLPQSSNQTRQAYFEQSKQKIMQQIKQTNCSSFFLDILPDNKEISSFVSDLSSLNKQDTYFKCVFIRQKFSSSTSINQNEYPMSVNFIFENYWQQSMIKKLPKIDERVQKLKIVTQQLEQLKNYETNQQVYDINVPLKEVDQNQITKIIEQIFQNSGTSKEKNSYYQLLIRLEKVSRDSSNNIDFDYEIQHLIKNSHTFIPTICFNKE